MDHTVIANPRNNQVNKIVNTKLKFESNYSLAKYHIKGPQPVVKF